MEEKKRKFQAGKNTTIRFPKDYPYYAIEFLNESNTSLPDLILKGIQVLMEEKERGIFFPSTLSPEKKKKLEGNPELQKAIMKWVDELVFSNKPLGRIEVAATSIEDSPIDEDLKEFAEDILE